MKVASTVLRGGASSNRSALLDASLLARRKKLKYFAFCERSEFTLVLREAIALAFLFLTISKLLL